MADTCTALTATRTRRRLLALTIGGLALVGGLTSAAAQAPLTTDVPVERMRWIADRDGVLDVPWGTVLPSLSLAAGLGFSYANDPLTIYRDEGGDRVRVASPVSGRAGAELVAALGVSDLLEFGLAMPLVLQQSSSAGSLMLPSSSSAGIGDIRVSAKLGLLRQRTFGVDGAATLVVGFPTATSTSYIGESGPVAEPGVAVSRKFSDVWRATATLGYRLRDRTESLALVVDDELVAAVGVGFRVAAADGPGVELGASVNLATAAGDALGSFDRNYAELKLGGAFSPMPRISVLLGGGVGMAQGFGTPDWRAFAGARFTFSVADALAGGGDDGVDVPKLDIAKAGTISRTDPITKPEPTDDDHDGFVGDADACPYQAEVVNGYLDDDGCPDTLPDRDHDGRLDQDDQCPDEPEDLDGMADEDGCPDLDDDADGVLDRDDRCPREPGVADNGGCPDPDRDGDTVVDRLDNCPDEPGTPANAGCKAKQLVRLTGDKIEILDAVYFRTDKADIRSKSFKLLDNVAKVLAGHPEITVRIEGHTDSEGDDAHNQDLSQRRAESVLTYLVKKKIDRARLTAQGFGETAPIADNGTSKGKAANRRVVFAITSGGDGAVVVDPTGAPATPAPAPPTTPTP
ncbi:MAG: OmpA family protein [Myxococcales bacterium]|nr:OmpA family protein [Myxococcales bacterium]